MLSGFKEFVMRGNVIELAVAVVMGTAVTALVTAFTESIINPLIAAVGGDDELGFGFTIVSGNDATFVNVGALITAFINFFIIAAVLYFVLVMPMNRFRSKFAKPTDDAPPPEDIALLREIRDELRAARGSTGTGGPGSNGLGTDGPSTDR